MATTEIGVEDIVARRFRAVLTVFVVAALALPGTGCVAGFFLQDAACHGFTVEDPLLEIRFVVYQTPLRYGVVMESAESLLLMVGHDGKAGMLHESGNRSLLRSRCRPLAADDLAEVIRAVERLEHSVVAEREVIRQGCRESTGVVLRGDDLLKSFRYCGTTPPAEVVSFVEEVSAPLGRRFGKELAAGLAAAAPWAPPVPLEPPEG